MKLYIARHGDALDKETAASRGLTDRPLSEAGKVGVARVAAVLRESGVRVQRVFHSDKQRTVQTARLLSTALADGDTAVYQGLHPNDPVTAFLAEAATWTEDTLVVGHLPFQELALSALVAGNAEAGIARLAAGAVACLERDTAGKRWSLLWLVSPDCLGS